MKPETGIDTGTTVGDSSSTRAQQEKTRVAGIFDRVALSYSFVGPPFFAHYGRRLVDLAQIPQGARVLDIGTGRGAVLLPAVESVGPAGSVIGIDLSEEMVQATRHDARRLGLGNVEVLKMDAEDLEFPDASFDWVLCGFGLFFFPQVSRALAAIRRVLKPGGRFAASTWGKEGPAWESLYNLRKAHLPPAAKPASDVTQAPDFETPRGMRELLSEAGFVDIRVLEEATEFVYRTKEEWWATQWTHGFRGTLEKIEGASGPEGLAKFQSEVFERLDTLATPDGIRHPMPVLFTLAAKPGEKTGGGTGI